ncbi:hypothetical protein B0A48_09593 [Cryoendolithus antarcticus]|uniref:Cercosporin MFS transporter CTB4 n=1 Tax=Cryoendolithus antarcticus TaxID=1507870 RepID=A0A1V8T080_9PEZI|nr:hypothetical protein B0A48_09593 [Cryoendolithus antarcticus]
MTDLIRDAPVGQMLRWVTGNRILRYPEEHPDFVLPNAYAEHAEKPRQQSDATSLATPNVYLEDPKDLEKSGVEPSEPSAHLQDRHALERLETAPDLEKAETRGSQIGRLTTLSSQISRTATLSGLKSIHTRADLEDAMHVASFAKQPSAPIIPERTRDGLILVSFYTTDDAENPQSWSQKKKGFASLQIYLYTLAVYMGSAIYAPSTEGVAEEFGVSITAASLGLALYVLAYGLGPLIFSPISELPVVGRNPPYMITMGIYVALCVAAPLVQNFAGLLVIRFLQGFFGSPCLATGGASLGDMYSFIKLPYVLCLWAFAATCGPALGPLISGFSVMAEGWRWSLWEMLWLSGPVFIMMLLFLPETSQSNILLRRARRLRKLTGNDKYRSQSELDQANLNAREIAYEALVRPMQLMFMDPAIGFTAVYVGLVYGIFYSYFECFPIVFMGNYGFNLGEMGLAFMAITVATIFAISAYYAYNWYIVEPNFRAHGIGKPEARLVPALIVSFFLPIGLFIFAWTSDGSIHWIVPILGVFIFTIGVFILIQCIFVYLPFVYPQYAASLFAGNDFARSSIAFAAILFSRPMFLNMGVGPAVSLLGALTAVCIGGIFVLYFYGERLRARSKFSAK